MADATAETALLGERVSEGPISLLPHLTRAAVCAQLPGGGIRVDGDEQTICVLNGPLPELQAGVYELRIHCRSGTPRMPQQPVFGVEIAALGHGSLFWRDFCSDEIGDGSLVVRFAVPPELAGRFIVPPGGANASLQFKLFHFNNADLEITDAVVAPANGAVPDRSRYRPIGRAWSKHGARGANGHVRVSAQSRPGSFLLVPVPALHPGRRYRLHIKGRVGAVALANQPVLGAEVIETVEVLQLQVCVADFTAQELERGNAAIEFRIQPRPRSEDNVGIELHHFGNAELEIEHLELTEIGDSLETENSRTWRLGGRLQSRSSLMRRARSAMTRVFNFVPLLYGVRPRLRATAGWHRLTVQLDNAAATPPSGTMFDVEVVAIGSWRPPRWVGWLFQVLRWRVRARLASLVRHEVRAGDLRDREIVCNFLAPFEWSYDGEHLWLDVRLFNRAMRRLQISQVTIERLNAAEAAAAEREVAAKGVPAVVPRVARPKLVVFGNCHAERFAQIIRTELQRDFAVSYQFPHVRESWVQRYRHEIEHADILFVQDIADWKNFSLREHVRDRTRVVMFPSLRLASLWPFDHNNGWDDPDARRQDWPPNTFRYLDGLLGRLRKELPDRERRFASYASLDLDLPVDPVRLHKFETRRLTAMDKRYGMQVGQYILENFQSRRLFFNTIHPVGELHAMMFRQLARQLEFRPPPNLGKYFDERFSLWQVPVHPVVAKRLGVKWANEQTTYLHHPSLTTWEAYVRKYINHFG